jgi:hypothetical protein
MRLEPWTQSASFRLPLSWTGGPRRCGVRHSAATRVPLRGETRALRIAIALRGGLDAWKGRGMTDPVPAQSCQVCLLVPHPRRTAVLVAADATSVGTLTPARHARLPTLRLQSAEPLLSEILASVDVVDSLAG